MRAQYALAILMFMSLCIILCFVRFLFIHIAYTHIGAPYVCVCVCMRAYVDPVAFSIQYYIFLFYSKDSYLI
jgi:hypothetical protein